MEKEVEEEGGSREEGKHEHFGPDRRALGGPPLTVSSECPHHPQEPHLKSQGSGLASSLLLFSLKTHFQSQENLPLVAGWGSRQLPTLGPTLRRLDGLGGPTLRMLFWNIWGLG
jgi:hypothetical protein